MTGGWLHQKYITEKLNTKQIAKLVGCSDVPTVTRNLKKFDIPIRSLSERRRNEHEDYFRLNMPVINGSLLGDAFITKPQKEHWNASLSKRNIYYDHLLYFAKQVLIQSPENRISGPFESSTNLTPNGVPTHFFNTYKHPEITSLRKQWYPKGIKVIPRDIELTKESLLHWFLDDGYSYVVRQKYKTSTYTSVRVFFCTQSFTKPDQLWLCQLLQEKFGLKFSLRKKGLKKDGTEAYIMALSESQTNYFFDLIGECPVDSLKYKWKRPA